MSKNKAQIIGVVGLDGNGTVILNAEMSDQEIKLLLQHVLQRLDQHAGVRNLVR